MRYEGYLHVDVEVLGLDVVDGSDCEVDTRGVSFLAM